MSTLLCFLHLFLCKFNIFFNCLHTDFALSSAEEQPQFNINSQRLFDAEMKTAFGILS